MSILGWIVLGLVAGFIASRLVGGGGGLLVDLVLGVVGAFVGGAAFTLIGQVGFTGFNLWSLLVAVVGAVLVLLVYHAISGRSGGSKPSSV